MQRLDGGGINDSFQSCTHMSLYIYLEWVWKKRGRQREKEGAAKLRAESGERLRKGRLCKTRSRKRKTTPKHTIKGAKHRQ
jgi:hypothetical protein